MRRPSTAIRAVLGLAPLHNPANLLGIDAARARSRSCRTSPSSTPRSTRRWRPQAYLYAMPYELYERHQVRRYGFHGTSHRYVAGEAARLLGRPLEELQLVTAHLGNGCSACAIKAGGASTPAWVSRRSKAW